MPLHFAFRGMAHTTHVLVRAGHSEAELLLNFVVVKAGIVSHLDFTAVPSRAMIRVVCNTTRKVAGVAAAANVPSQEVSTNKITADPIIVVLCAPDRCEPRPELAAARLQASGWVAGHSVRSRFG